MSKRNAKPERFYGLHFQEGVAEYKDLEENPMWYISRDTAKQMDRTFGNKPVFVMHEEDPELDNVQEADGVVIRSFFNQPDGNHWVEFIVYTEEALEKLRAGWKLSNAYLLTNTKGSGSWHGVEYDKEVGSAEYEHLAIVPNPRYADSIVLTPDEFKQYNLDKEAELLRLANSKEKPMFKIFKKQKVENSDDLSEMSVMLPKSKVEKTITQLVNEADEKEEKKGMANEDDTVKVDNEDMSVKELVNFYKKNKKKKNEDDDDDVKTNEEKEAEEKKKNEEEEEKKKNEEEEEELKNKGKKKNSDDSELAKAQEDLAIYKARFDKLQNAHVTTTEEVSQVLDTMQDGVARGKAKYGSE